MQDDDVEGQQYFPFFIDIKREEILNQINTLDSDTMNIMMKERDRRFEAMKKLVEEAQELNMGY